MYFYSLKDRVATILNLLGFSKIKSLRAVYRLITMPGANAGYFAVGSLAGNFNGTWICFITFGQVNNGHWGK